MNQGMHHLHTRKRIYENLEPYPHPDKWKRFFDRLIYVVGLATPLVLLPQVVQVWVYRNTSGIAVSTWFLLGIINILWVAYGMIHRAKALVLSNILMAVLNLMTALGVLIFG